MPSLLQQIQLQKMYQPPEIEEDNELILIAVRKKHLRNMPPPIGRPFPKNYQEAVILNQQSMNQHVLDKLPKRLAYSSEFIAEVGSKNCCIYKSRYSPPYRNITPEDFIFHMVDLLRLIPCINLFDVNEKGKVF